MTPSQARAFQAVATEGSFTAGARKLGVSQPTVTNQVKQIEGRYGVELFHRTSHGVRLTTTGEELLTIVRRVFGSFDEALAYLQEAQGMRLGRLRVGSYGPYDVIPMVARYREHYPAIAVTIEFANSRDLAQHLLHYDLDVAVLGRDTYRPEFQVLPFSAPALIAIAPRSGEWGGRKSITVEEFRKHTLICREPGSAARNAFDTLSRQRARAGRDPHPDRQPRRHRRRSGGRAWIGRAVRRRRVSGKPGRQAQDQRIDDRVADRRRLPQGTTRNADVEELSRHRQGDGKERASLRMRAARARVDYQAVFQGHRFFECRLA